MLFRREHTPANALRFKFLDLFLYPNLNQNSEGSSPAIPHPCTECCWNPASNIHNSLPLKEGILIRRDSALKAKICVTYPASWHTCCVYLRLFWQQILPIWLGERVMEPCRHEPNLHWWLFNEEGRELNKSGGKCFELAKQGQSLDDLSRLWNCDITMLLSMIL